MAAIAVAVLAAVYVRSRGLAQPGFISDFDQVWAAARAWVQGRNPYDEVGPGAPFHWKWPLYYPFPAVLLATPVALLPVLYARMVFAGVSAGLFTWAISRDGWARWPILFSVAFLVSVDLVQWSPLLSAMYFIPALGALVVVKPNFGLPLLAAAVRRRDALWIVGGGAGLVVVSLALLPSWPAEWLANVRSAPHFRAPVTRPLGFLLLLAVLRWRRAEARWLLGLALMPQAPSFYDPLLLVAVCVTWWESAVLALGTWALLRVAIVLGPQVDYAIWGPVVGNAAIWTCYLPALVIILLRPNVGPVPAVFPRFWAKTGQPT